MNNDTLDRIISLLIESKFQEQALELEGLRAQYLTATKEDKITIRGRLKEMCHTKWLGDFNVEGISLNDWYGLLDRLSKSL